MPLWGFFHNSLEFVTTQFAKAGKSFSEAYSVFKEIVRAKEPKRQYQRWREKVITERVKPFVQATPDWLKVAPEYIVSTPAILKEKFQYIFDIGFQFKGVPIVERQFYSFLSSKELTMVQARKRMIDVIMLSSERGKYPELVDLDIQLNEVRTSLLDV